MVHVRSQVLLPAVVVGLASGLVGVVYLAVLHLLSEEGVLDRGLKIRTMTLPDMFLDHAAPRVMYEKAGLNASQIAATAMRALGQPALVHSLSDVRTGTAGA